MQELKYGDLYSRPFITGFFLAVGYPANWQYGNYKQVFWDEFPPGHGRSERRCDLFRLSDGPDDLVGAAYETPDKDEWIALINRTGMFDKGMKYFKSEFEATRWLIEFSEDELEKHFNSLQFA